MAKHGSNGAITYEVIMEECNKYDRRIECKKIELEEAFNIFNSKYPRPLVASFFLTKK